MPAILEIESKLTDRYQTTIPDTVRRALNLRKRDTIHYSISPDGAVVMKRADQGEDPVLAPFLALLAEDIAKHPARLKPVDKNLIRRIKKLVGKVSVDLNARLSPDGD